MEYEREHRGHRGKISARGGSTCGMKFSVYSVVGFYKILHKMIEPTKVKKILVFAYMGIGNLIIFLPTLLAFKKHFPEAKFSLVTNKNRSASFKELLSGFDFHLIDEFIDFEGINASFGEKIEFIKRIRNSQFDMLIKNFLGGINL